jgi:hypothetical protein
VLRVAVSVWRRADWAWWTERVLADLRSVALALVLWLRALAEVLPRRAAELLADGLAALVLRGEVVLAVAMWSESPVLSSRRGPVRLFVLCSSPGGNEANQRTHVCNPLARHCYTDPFQGVKTS